MFAARAGQGRERRRRQVPTRNQQLSMTGTASGCGWRRRGHGAIARLRDCLFTAQRSR
jgi:hypothetical protein